MKDFENYSLKEHNTFGIEAKCRRFLEYTNIEETQQVSRILRESDTPYIIIGGGSNLLMTKDFEGIVVRSDVLGYYIDGEGYAAVMLGGKGSLNGQWGFIDKTGKSLFWRR